MKVVNPQMIVLARESRGMTQAQLAKAVNLSQAEISRYESDMRNVSDEHLERIADVLDYPRAFFYQQGQRYGLGSSGFYHRKRKTVPARDLNKINARLNILRFMVDRLLEGVDIGNLQPFPRHDVKNMKDDVEGIAELVRAAWKLPAGPIRDLVGVIENAGGIVHRMDFGTRKVDALVQWYPPTPPIFLINESSPGDRLRFTLSHEIAHVVMHEAPTDEMEEEADRFAAAFLMPARDILPDFNHVTLPHLAQLKPYWRVSIAALIRRAYDLGAITERQYRALYEQMAQQGYRIEEPYPIAIEQPTLLKEVFDAHTGELGYSMTELAAIFGLYEDELRAVYSPHRPILRLVPPLRQNRPRIDRGTNLG